MEIAAFSRRRFVRQSLVMLAGSAIALRCQHDPIEKMFEIPDVVLLAPVGGAQLDLGATTAITWKSITVERLHISFTFDGGLTWQTIATDVDARLGQYLWTAPAREYAQCRLRLQASGLSGLSVVSAPFSVRWRQVIRLTDHPDLHPIGSSKIFASAVAGNFVVRRLGAVDFQVMSLYCTHNGCTVEWEAGKQQYKCPCHFSIFDSKGCALNGPATIPLNELQAEYDATAGVLMVQNVVLPNTHSDC